MQVFSAPATLTLLPEECGNIHAFEAITPCAVFDVLAECTPQPSVAAVDPF